MIDRVSKCGGILRLDEQTSFALADDIADARHICRNDRNAGGHGFDEDQAEAFGDAGEDEQADLLQGFLRVGGGAVEGDFFAQAVGLDGGDDVGAGGALAEDVQVDVGFHVEQGAEEVRDALDRVEPRTVSFPGAEGSICGMALRRADVAQLVEQRFCKPPVPGSSPVVGSIREALGPT